MPYGFTMPKKPPCPLNAKDGKHKWSFVRNGTVTKASHGFGGGAIQISARGLYKCECGATRVGQARHDQPGADIRNHIGVRVASATLTKEQA